jgi:glutamate--cysteine ligase
MLGLTLTKVYTLLPCAIFFPHGTFAACCRFGTEHEKLGYNLSDHKRIDYDSIKALLEGLCSRFGWEPIMEGQYIIGAVLDGQSVTIEPGGQFELSGAPVDTLHKTCSEVNSHLYQVCTAEQL